MDKEQKMKINKEGNLEINRAGNFKKVCCPYDNVVDGGWYCGDWCALFREPQLNDYDSHIDVEIELCRVSYICEQCEFEDQRNEKNKD